MDDKYISKIRIIALIKWINIDIYIKSMNVKSKNKDVGN